MLGKLSRRRPLDRFRITLIGALQRILRRQSQLGEQFSHSSQFKPNVKLLCDKVRHNGSRYANAQAMNVRLEEISCLVTQGSHAVLLPDRAGWHQMGGKLRIPKNVSLLPLPPYSPELNPVENIWQFLRQNHLSNHVFKNYNDILDACCAAWNALVEEPKRIASIATRDFRHRSLPNHSRRGEIESRFSS